MALEVNMHWYELRALRITAVVALLMLPMLAIAQPLPPPDAVPGLEGKRIVSAPYVVRTDSGWHLFVLAMDKEGTLWAPGFSCPHGSCDSWATFATKLEGWHKAPDRVAAFKNAWAANIKWDCSEAIRQEYTQRGAMCRERLEVTQDAAVRWRVANVVPRTTPTPVPTPVPTPTPAAWKVKTNGTAATRPAYQLTDGVRGTKEIGRAPVGDPCDPSKPTLASGSDLWASYGSTPVAGQVALCSKVAP